MSNIIRKGYTVEKSLKEFGYDGYSVECTYRYNKSKEKYRLSMGLRCKGMGNRFSIKSVDLHDIDAQYIPGTRETILDNVDRIIEYAATHETDEQTHTKFFDPYIEEIEYMSKCIDKGNELFEEERLEGINDTEE